MSSPLFTEDHMVEQTALGYFASLYGPENCINAFTDEGDALLGRDHHEEVVLKSRLVQSLRKLNAGMPESAISEAVTSLLKDRSRQDRAEANREVHGLIRDGVKVRYRKPNGEMVDSTVRILDFENPSNNDFLVVSQMRISGETYYRRPDIIGFVNGLPLFLLELKRPTVPLREGFDKNLSDYFETIPQLFPYNAFVMVSNGISTKVGTITSGWEHFSEWKRITGEKEPASAEMKTAVFGMCERTRLLDLVENFTLFDTSKGRTVKILAKYHQYYGVNLAVEGVMKREENRGKLGVFWHTQGSGKSFSMAFFTRKVEHKVPGNFTFVVVTDRTELDEQVAKNFSSVGVSTSKRAHATKIRELAELLSGDERYVFTLIHKFADIAEAINTRSDIIVMTDEAHRSQYGELAMRMRLALPNASFIGFTGTPLIKGEDEKTREVFGNYVSVYDFGQAVEDGSTVPIYYENRVPKLENTNADLQKEIDALIERADLSEDGEEKLEKEFSTAYHLITREDRLESVAEDLAKHFVGRWPKAKAMVVSIDKKTTVRLFEKVRRQFQVIRDMLKRELLSETVATKREKIEEDLKGLENLDMAVVLSLGDERKELETFREMGIDFAPIRGRIAKEDLETAFKAEGGNLRLCFVCSMWLTGFDVPDLATLYLDKPLKGHTLAQTIARVNRVYKEKQNGLIVDYIGIFAHLRQALAIYAANGMRNAENIVQDKAKLIAELRTGIRKAESLLGEVWIRLEPFLTETDGSVLLKLSDDAVNTLKDPKSGIQTDFFALASGIAKIYDSILPDVRAAEFSRVVNVLRFLSESLRNQIREEIDISEVVSGLESILDASVKAEKFEITERFNIKDLSKIDFDALGKFFQKTKHKHTEIERIRTGLEAKIEEMVRKNPTRKPLAEKLEVLMSAYNAGTKSADEAFEDLVDLAKLLKDEESRAIRENLTEEELALFDILRKEHITPAEEAKVKAMAKELLETLKREKLVMDWRKKEQARSEVRLFLEDRLWTGLPKSYYDENLYEPKVNESYQFIYENYPGWAVTA